MSEEQKVSMPPRPQIDLGSILALFQAKLLGHEAMMDSIVDVLTTHDFTKGPITREELDTLIKQKIELIAKHAEELAQKNNILLAQPKSPIILPK